MSLEDLVLTDQRLGAGHFGSVFVCELDGKKVAAKKLSQSENEFSNLVREASRLKRLEHGKHIAYTYGITMKEESMYMVMEYSVCGDLQNYLIRNKESVTYEQKILFCRGILLGLLYCHLMHIFHGDIKCSNVILGKNLEPKLTDFGLSMTVDNVEYYSKLYNGSLYWVAPEMFFIEEDETVYQEFIADPYSCDIYSLGATFCEISYNGAIDFIDSDNPGMDVMLGLVSPIPKDAFLEKIVSGCCQFERDKRISLDKCFTLLDAVAEKEFPIPDIDDKWLRIQQDVKANSKLEVLPSFILHRPTENLVVGPSNLSLLERLCINNCVEAVTYMTQPNEYGKYDQNQIEWLYGISELCKSLEVCCFLQSLMPNMEFSSLKLSNLIDKHPQQFIEMLIKVEPSCCGYNLLKKVIEKGYNIIVRAIISSKSHFKDWAIHDAIKFGNTEAVKIFANAGANLESEDHCTRTTPLEVAIETENIEIVKILLGFDIYSYNKNNYTLNILEAELRYRPLHFAALRGNREIVKLLIDAGVTMVIESYEWSSLSQDLEQQGNISMERFIRNNISKKPNPVENSSLCAAIRNKQPDLVQTFISDGESIDEIGLDGYAPLHWAVTVGDEEIVRILIKAGADLDIRTSSEAQTLHSAPDCFNECAPLHIVVSKGHLEIAKLLIESGADFSAKNGPQQAVMDIAKEDRKILEEIIREYVPVDSISIQRVMKAMSHESIKIMISNRQINAEFLSECLCIAISSGENDLVKYLLKHGANINQKYQDKIPLEWAISGGNMQIMEILIDAGADVNMRSGYWETPLFNCVWESQVDMVQFLVDKGADVNIRKLFKYQPIHFVKDREIAEILIAHGADINSKSEGDRTPLFLCVEKSLVDMVQFLVDKGADVNTRDQNGKAVICHADHKEVVKILVNAGADVNAEDECGITLLFQHVKKTNIEMAQFLVDIGADVNARDKDGNAPVHFVKDKDVLEILINAGADINAKDWFGKTCLIQHVKESNTEMVQFLVDKGADVNARDRDGNASIHYTNGKEIMEILINAGADVNTKDQNGIKSLIQPVRKSNTTILRSLANKGADEYEGKTLIRYVRKSNTEMVQLLVDKGADVNAKNKYGNAPIHCAENREIMEILINAGADINVKDQFGETPLIRHVSESNKVMVQFLIDKGADINARDEDKDAPIHHAIHREMMEILINAGADINAENEFGETPLFQHVKKTNIEMVQFLIDKGANVNARNRIGHKPFYYMKDIEILKILINTKNQDEAEYLIQCVKISNIEMVQFLVEEGADVNARNKYGRSPIYYTDDKEIMEILINAGVDVNAKDQDGVTPLIQHVKESNIEIVQLVVNKGADVNARDKDGNMPIHFVNDMEIMKIIVNAGADVNAKDQDRTTPLIQHVKKADTEMVQLLIDKGADVNARDKHGNAPIYFARNTNTIEILINVGADVNAKGQYKRTPLIQFVEESNTEIVQFLIDKGADVNAKNEYGNAPIHCAENREIMEILINAGADINAKNQLERTPLTRFIDDSNTEIVQFLVDKGADVNVRDKDSNVSIHFVRDKGIAVILINAGADFSAKNRHGKSLFNILAKEQNINLSNNQYKNKRVCELLEYLRDINRNKV